MTESREGVLDTIDCAEALTKRVTHAGKTLAELLVGLADYIPHRLEGLTNALGALGDVLKSLADLLLTDKLNLNLNLILSHSAPPSLPALVVERSCPRWLSVAHRRLPLWRRRVAGIEQIMKQAPLYVESRHAR